MGRPARASRGSALSASKKISTQVKTDEESPELIKRVPKRPVRDHSPSESEATAGEESEEPAPKKRKPQASKGKGKGKGAAAELHLRLFGPEGKSGSQPCAPPRRRHGVDYHRPALLDDAENRGALLSWFDGVSTKRQMPWRKAWINPRDHSEAELRDLLERRAYEVWISEIMLQQTRVAVVIDYWNNWMAKWQTIHDLAAADADDVLSAWRGLGYYSRATRIHEAAKLVVKDPGMKGLLPSYVPDLEAKVPGVGRYTAGAISAIVFGRAVPMVDGNVLRVLSRQLGLLGNVKSDKLVIDTLWAAADALAKAVAGDKPEAEDEAEDGDDVSNRPGRWGQALMELGSTICAPKPNCSECPISATCRAYGEGKLLADGAKATTVGDIEDCDLCEPLEDSEEPEAVDVKTKKPAAKQPKQMKLSAFAFKTAAPPEDKLKKKPAVSAKQMETIVEHARKFPVKVVKKAVRVEDTLVCVIRRSDGQYLIHKRPEKGLLAGLWEFPSQILPEDEKHTGKTRRSGAIDYVSELLAGQDGAGAGLKHVGELESVPWLFSHIKLTMHVHLFTLDKDCVGDEEFDVSARLKWASSEHVDSESMGTGMRKCWALAKDHDD